MERSEVIKPVENEDGRFIGDHWWLSYEKTESFDPTKPYRQFQMFSSEHGCTSLNPWRDSGDEHVFAEIMLIRAAPKMLTILDHLMKHIKGPMGDLIQKTVHEAQWTYDEWHDNAEELR